MTKNNAIPNVFEDLNILESTEIGGGDGITKAVFWALGYIVQSISNGVAATQAGSPGTYYGMTM